MGLGRFLGIVFGFSAYLIVNRDMKVSEWSASWDHLYSRIGHALVSIRKVTVGRDDRSEMDWTLPYVSETSAST